MASLAKFFFSRCNRIQSRWFQAEKENGRFSNQVDSYKMENYKYLKM